MNVAVVQVPIGRMEGCAVSHADDLLAVEEALEIRLGNRSLTITMRTPGHDFELAAGFLHAEGMTQDISQIRSMGRPSDGSADAVVVELDGALQVPPQAQRNFFMTSACGVCGNASLQDLEVNACPVLLPDDIQLSPEIIHRLPDALRGAQRIFESTGGLHAAASFDLRGNLECLREDVGRHNAVDKLVGAALLERRLPMSTSLLLVSGQRLDLVREVAGAEVGVAERHFDRSMPGEFLDCGEWDTADRKPRTKGVAEIVEPKVVNLRAGDRSIERVLDVGDGLAFELSVQVNKDVWMGAGLLMNFLQLLEGRIV